MHHTCQATKPVTLTCSSSQYIPDIKQGKQLPLNVCFAFMFVQTCIRPVCSRLPAFTNTFPAQCQTILLFAASMSPSGHVNLGVFVLKRTLSRPVFAQLQSHNIVLLIYFPSCCVFQRHCLLPCSSPSLDRKFTTSKPSNPSPFPSSTLQVLSPLDAQQLI